MNKENLHQLKNLLSPILNYIEMEREFKEDGDKLELKKLVHLEESINELFPICVDVLPQIKELLHESK